jgi:hypothetical protein
VGGLENPAAPFAVCLGQKDEKIGLIMYITGQNDNNCIKINIAHFTQHNHGQVHEELMAKSFRFSLA